MNGTTFYTLNSEHQPINTTNLTFWVAWMQDHVADIMLAVSDVGLIRISTVFMGVSAISMVQHQPLQLFETLTFTEDITDDWYHRQQRYDTYEQAMAGHRAMVKQAQDDRDGQEMIGK